MQLSVQPAQVQDSKAHPLEIAKVSASAVKALWHPSTRNREMPLSPSLQLPY
jgi:hypothetical protein